MGIVTLDEPCSCGCTRGQRIEVAKDDKVIATGVLCDDCFGEALDGAARWRREFNDLIASGVGNAEANREIIARMHAERTAAPRAVN